MISSPLKCQIIPQSQEYEHIIQPWTFHLDRRNLRAYPNISELCQQTMNKSSRLLSSSFPWILSSHLQTSTWNIVPVAGTKEQVSAWGTPAPYSQEYVRGGHIPSCRVWPMQEGWVVQHKTLIVRNLHLWFIPAETKQWQQVPGKVNEWGHSGSILCLCFCSSPCLTLVSISSAQLVAGCLSGRLHTWHIPEQLQAPFPSICKSFCAIPSCSSIILHGLSTGVEMKHIQRNTYIFIASHLHLIFTASVLFLSDAKEKRMWRLKYRNYNIEARLCSHLVKPVICYWSKFNNVYVCKAALDTEKTYDQCRRTLRELSESKKHKG